MPNRMGYSILISRDGKWLRIVNILNTHKSVRFLIPVNYSFQIFFQAELGNGVVWM